MPSTGPRIENLTIAAVAGILVYQLMTPPVIGLADQGDYARLLGPFHLGPVAQTAEDRYYRYLNRTYQHDPNFKLPGWEMYSTQDVFVGAAMVLNQWISKDGLFDIRVLSFFEILAFVAVCYWLLRVTCPLISGWMRVSMCTALVLIFCDVGYVSYFDSFYSEPATYIFLLALMAAWLNIIANGGGGAKDACIFVLCVFLFIAAKPQNVAAGVILGLYMLRFRSLIQPRWLAPALSVFILAASFIVYWTVPRLVRLAQIYNVVFMDMLPQSEDPAAELRSLGLDAAYAKYSGSGAFAPSTGFWNPSFRDELERRVNRFTIIRQYGTHPAKLLRYVRAVLPRGSSLRAEGVGNFERSAGRPPFARAESFALWSHFHERYLARWSSGVLIGLMLSAPFAGWIAASARSTRERLLAECFGMLALSAVAVFFTTILGDAHDIVKHLHLYNLLTDICLVFATLVAMSCAKKLWPSVFFRNRNRSSSRSPARQRSESRSRVAGLTSG